MADESLSFPPEYDSYYQLLLQKTAEEHGPSETPLTNFWPARGSKCSANAALVIVGRAVNGLDEGWLPVQVISPEARIEMLSTMRKASEGCHSCPLSWVTKPPKRGEYNPNRSAFWRLGRTFTTLCVGFNPIGRATFVGLIFSNYLPLPGAILQVGSRKRKDQPALSC